MHAVQLFHNYENSYALLASSYFRVGMLKQTSSKVRKSEVLPRPEVNSDLHNTVLEF